MRIALIIVVLTAIAVALVHLRRQEVVRQHEIQRLQSELVRDRQQVRALEVRLGRLTSVEALQIRARQQGLALEAPSPATAIKAPALTTDISD